MVFDLGGVLARAEGAPAALSDAVGVPADVFAERYLAHRDAYDLGAPAAEYWRRVVTAPGPNDEDVERLARIDAAWWATLATGVAELLDAVVERGVPLAILSNAPAALAAAVRAAEWAARFGTLIFSSDLALLKPDPRIYQAADALLGTEPADVVFFDDRAVNVDAARAHGWRAHAWPGTAKALEILAREGVTRA